MLHKRALFGRIFIAGLAILMISVIVGKGAVTIEQQDFLNDYEDPTTQVEDPTTQIEETPTDNGDGESSNDALLSAPSAFLAITTLLGMMLIRKH